MVASIIVSIILLLLMGGLAFGAVILNLFDKVKDEEVSVDMRIREDDSEWREPLADDDFTI